MCRFMNCIENCMTFTNSIIFPSLMLLLLVKVKKWFPILTVIGMGYPNYNYTNRKMEKSATRIEKTQKMSFLVQPTL